MTDADLTKTLKKLESSNGSYAGLCLINPDYRIEWASVTAARPLAAAVCAGESCYRIFEKAGSACKNCPTKKSFQDGKAHQIVRSFSSNASRKSYIVTSNPIKDKNNRVVKVLEIIQDVNGLKKYISGNGTVDKGGKFKRLKAMCITLKKSNQKLRQDVRKMRKVGSEGVSQINNGLKKRFRGLLKQLQNTKEELHDLLRVNEAVSTNGDSVKTTHLVVRLLQQIMHADAVTIRFVDNERRVLIPKDCVGINKEVLMETPFKIGESFEGRVAQNGKVLTCRDMCQDSRSLYPEKAKEYDLRSAIFVPATFNKETLAVMALFYRQDRQFNDEEIALMKAFGHQIAIAIQETKNSDDVNRNYFSTLKSLVLAMEARDPYTKGHSERVTRYALDIALELKLPTNWISMLRFAGTVHDVGKIGISDLILNKPGRLTAAERAIIELHPIKGAKMLDPLKFLRPGIPVVRHHHERFDGLGYPDRIAGEEIPLSARILTCADSFDAMTSERPYRLKKMSVEEAVAELRTHSGAQFDSKIVSIFINLIKKKKYI